MLFITLNKVFEDLLPQYWTQIQEESRESLKCMPDVPIDFQIRDNITTIVQEIKNKIQSEKRMLT